MLELGTVDQPKKEDRKIVLCCFFFWWRDTRRINCRLNNNNSWVQRATSNQLSMQLSNSQTNSEAHKGLDAVCADYSAAHTEKLGRELLKVGLKDLESVEHDKR